MNRIIEVIIIATGQKVKVYKLKSGGWALYEDGGKTIFQDNQIKMA